MHIFSPTLTNEASASRVWGNIPIIPGNSSLNYRSTLGATIGCVYCTNPKYMPTFGGVQNNFPGSASEITGNPPTDNIVRSQFPNSRTNLTKVWGKHTSIRRPGAPIPTTIRATRELISKGR